MESDLISIVMPVKNAGKYLKECVDSIIKQSESNWELIAINDHSTDSSEKLLTSYSQKDSRITYFNNEGSGIIPALQQAYRYSRGAFIHRMDADDIMEVNKLKLLKKQLKESGKGTVVTAHVRYFAEHGVSDGYLQYEEWLNQLCSNNSHWKEIYKECVIASPCWLIHREDFERCGGFNSDIYPEDYDLVFRFYQQQLKVVSVNETLHLWRDHSLRTSRNHIHYQQNAFFEIKLHYFFELEYDSSRPLVIWGAGKKGKIMAQLLQKRNIPFQWVSNNPNKEGKKIYDQLMESFETIVTQDNPQVIITVAQRNAKKEIIHFLEQLNLEEAQDYYFFR